MNMDKQEVLRYLGHKQQALSPRLSGEVDRAMAECRALSRPAHTSAIYCCASHPDGVALPEAGLVLRGKAIQKHLRHAGRAGVIAVTLGPGVEQAIRRHEYTDMTYALLLDASATQLVEAVCDEVQAGLAERARALGCCVNHRFSPGYGDLPLDTQPDIVRVLDTARRIGLACTDTCILTPRKSVTAILGFVPQERGEPAEGPGCLGCDMAEHCTFRKDGGHCGIS